VFVCLHFLYSCLCVFVLCVCVFFFAYVCVFVILYVCVFAIFFFFVKFCCACCVLCVCEMNFGWLYSSSCKSIKRRTELVLFLYCEVFFCLFAFFFCFIFS